VGGDEQGGLIFRQDMRITREKQENQRKNYNVMHKNSFSIRVLSREPLAGNSLLLNLRY